VAKKYKLVQVTIEMLGMFDAWIERRAFEAVDRSRNISDKFYHESLDSVIRLIASGQLSFGSPVCVDAARSREGIKYCLLLQLKAGNPGDHEIDEKFVSYTRPMILSHFFA